MAFPLDAPWTLPSLVGRPPTPPPAEEPEPYERPIERPRPFNLETILRLRLRAISEGNLTLAARLDAAHTSLHAHCSRWRNPPFGDTVVESFSEMIRFMASMGHAGHLNLEFIPSPHRYHDWAPIHWYRSPRHGPFPYYKDSSFFPETPGNSRISGSIGERLFGKELDNTVVLVCERCGHGHDKNMELIHARPWKLKGRELWNISYIHCSNNINNKCLLDPTDEWYNLERQVRKERKEAFYKLYDLVPHITAEELVDMVMGNASQNKAMLAWEFYASWRILWHEFNREQLYTGFLDESLREYLPLIKQVVPTLEFWGDLRLDYSLYLRGFISAASIEHVYVMPIDFVGAMIKDNVAWHEEVQAVDNFAGLRNGMERQQFETALREAQRAFISAERVQCLFAEAPQSSERDFYITNLVHDIRYRLQGLASSITASPELIAVRMTEITGYKAKRCAIRAIIIPTPRMPLVEVLEGASTDQADDADRFIRLPIPAGATRLRPVVRRCNISPQGAMLLM